MAVGRRIAVGIFDRLEDLAAWLPDDEAGVGHETSGGRGRPRHEPSRRWFGQVMPGTWAPNVDGDGVDGKIAGVAAIRAHDSAFDENVFLADVQRLFFAVLEAWTALKPQLSQGVMASAIWEEQKGQIADYRARGWRNLLPSLSFTSAVVVGERMGHADRAHQCQLSRLRRRGRQRAGARG